MYRRGYSDLKGIKPLNFRGLRFFPDTRFLQIAQIVPRFYGNYGESMIQHIKLFNAFIEDYGINNEIQVIILFAKTLKGYARRTYDSLPAHSISSFKEFIEWFVNEFYDENDKESIEEYQNCNMNKEPYISPQDKVYLTPLDAFNNLERYENENLSDLLMRMEALFLKIPDNVRPDFFSKIFSLGISLDQLRPFLEDALQHTQNEEKFLIDKEMPNPNEVSYLDREEASKQNDQAFLKMKTYSIHKYDFLKCCDTVGNDFGSFTKPLYDEMFKNHEFEHQEGNIHSPSEISCEDSVCDQVKEKSIHEDVSVEMNQGYEQEEPSIILEEISELLDIEYHKYVEKNSPVFFSNNYNEEVNDLRHIQDDGHENNAFEKYMHYDEGVSTNDCEEIFISKHSKFPHGSEEMVPTYELPLNPFCEKNFHNTGNEYEVATQHFGKENDVINKGNSFHKEGLFHKDFHYSFSGDEMPKISQEDIYRSNLISHEEIIAYSFLHNPYENKFYLGVCLEHNQDYKKMVKINLDSMYKNMNISNNERVISGMDIRLEEENFVYDRKKGWHPNITIGNYEVHISPYIIALYFLINYVFSPFSVLLLCRDRNKIFDRGKIVIF